MKGIFRSKKGIPTGATLKVPDEKLVKPGCQVAHLTKNHREHDLSEWYTMYQNKSENLPVGENQVVLFHPYKPQVEQSDKLNAVSERDRENLTQRQKDAELFPDKNKQFFTMYNLISYQFNHFLKVKSKI